MFWPRPGTTWPPQRAPLIPAVVPQDAGVGGSVDVAETLSTVSQTVLRANPRRKGFTLINDSTIVIYLSKTNPATPNSGIRLNTGGGSYSMPDSNGRIWKGTVYAVAASGTPVLCGDEDW